MSFICHPNFHMCYAYVFHMSTHSNWVYDWDEMFFLVDQYTNIYILFNFPLSQPLVNPHVCWSKTAGPAFGQAETSGALKTPEIGAIPMPSIQVPWKRPQNLRKSPLSHGYLFCIQIYIYMLMLNNYIMWLYIYDYTCINDYVTYYTLIMYVSVYKYGWHIMTALFRQDVFFSLRNVIPNGPRFQCNLPRSQPTQKGDHIPMYTQDIVGYRRYIQLYMMSVLPKKE